MSKQIIKTDNAPQAVRVDKTVYLSGQILLANAVEGTRVYRTALQHERGVA